MRCILIDPFARDLRELSLPMSGQFMEHVATLLNCDTLALDVAPPLTAMFLDATGFLRNPKVQAFWRQVGQPVDRNVAGYGLVFGLASDGRLAPLAPEITTADLRGRILWTDDTIERQVERLALVDTPSGKIPIVQHQIIWTPGATYPAATAAETPGVAQDAGDAYTLPAAPPAPPKPPAASAAPPAALSSVWVIRETDDNRYQTLEYEVRESGLGPVMSMRTVANIDEARSLVPPGLTQRLADDDTADETLVETWS